MRWWLVFLLSSLAVSAHAIRRIPGGVIEGDLLFSVLSIGSMVVAVAYVWWQVVYKKSYLLLIEAIFLVEDGTRVATQLDDISRRLDGHFPSKRRRALAEAVDLVRRHRYPLGELHRRMQSESFRELALDANSLWKSQLEVLGEGKPLGKYCLVGIIHTVDVQGGIFSGGIDAAAEHLAFVHDNQPLDVDAVYLYYRCFDEIDEAERFMNDLADTRIRSHHPDMSLV